MVELEFEAGLTVSRVRTLNHKLCPRSPSHVVAQLVFGLVCLFPGSWSSFTVSLCCFTVLPVRTRTGGLWTPAVIEGAKQGSHMSYGLADSQRALAHGGQIPGPVVEGGKNTCPFCLPSWARSVYQVGTWYVSNCSGGG